MAGPWKAWLLNPCFSGRQRLCHTSVLSIRVYKQAFLLSSHGQQRHTQTHNAAHSSVKCELLGLGLHFNALCQTVICALPEGQGQGRALKLTRLSLWANSLNAFWVWLKPLSHLCAVPVGQKSQRYQGEPPRGAPCIPHFVVLANSVWIVCKSTGRRTGI